MNVYITFSLSINLLMNMNYFQLLVTVNSTAMNTGVQVAVGGHVFNSVGDIARSF